MNYLPPQPEDSPPFDPLQRRLVGTAGFLAVVMIGLIAFHALHTGSTGLNAMAEAAQRTARQPGAKLAMEITYTVDTGTATKTVVGTGGGIFNAHTGRGRFSLSVPVPGRGPMSFDSVVDRRHSFIRSSAFGGELPAGKEWLGMEPFLGNSPETAFGSNGSAKSQLELMTTVGGGVERLDQQVVRGHMTTRYKGSVELAKAAEFLSEHGEGQLAQQFEKAAEQIPDPIPVEAWVDGKGLVRQIRVVESLPTGTDGVSETMDMRMQFFAFGVKPKIELPPKSRVFDLTPVLRAELGLENGSTFGSLAPPVGTEPLPGPRFRRQALHICHAFVAPLKQSLEENPGLAAKLKTLSSDGASPEEKRASFPAAGRFFERVARSARRTTFRLATLVPPSSLAGTYRRYLAVDAKQTEWVLAEARALQLGPDAILKLKGSLSTMKSEEAEGTRLEKVLGITGCGEESAPASGSSI